MPQFVLPLELEGRQHSVPCVLALRVVEHLDVVEHVLPGFLARSVGAAPDPLELEQVEEALDDGAIVAVASAAQVASGKRTYSITTRRMISGLVLNHLNGLGLVMPKGQAAPCRASSQFL